jgi:hypothetical protein
LARVCTAHIPSFTGSFLVALTELAAKIPREKGAKDMDKKKMIKVLEMIAKDQEADVYNFEGKPFDGCTVAEYFGNNGAAIASLANIVKSLIESQLRDEQAFLMVDEIESEYRETGIECPKCGNITYTNGKTRPMCAECLEELEDEYMWTWLITTRLRT